MTGQWDNRLKPSDKTLERTREVDEAECRWLTLMDDAEAAMTKDMARMMRRLRAKTGMPSDVIVHSMLQAATELMMQQSGSRYETGHRLHNHADGYVRGVDKYE